MIFGCGLGVTSEWGVVDLLQRLWLVSSVQASFHGDEVGASSEPFSGRSVSHHNSERKKYYHTNTPTFDPHPARLNVFHWPFELKYLAPPSSLRLRVVSSGLSHVGRGGLGEEGARRPFSVLLYASFSLPLPRPRYRGHRIRRWRQISRHARHSGPWGTARGAARGWHEASGQVRSFPKAGRSRK